MQKLFKPALALALACAALAPTQAAPLNTSDGLVYRPTGRGHGEIDEAASAAPSQDRLGSQAPITAAVTSNGITFHGGPVMTAATNVYIVWYGTWTAPQKTIVSAFFQGLSGTPIFNTNTSYYNAARVPVRNVVTLLGQYADNYSLGKALSDANIKTLVSNAITGGWLPKDTNGVYFVLTAPDVRETSGFGSQYCGWHTHGTIGGADIKYSFVGNPATIAPAGCGVSNPSPNGDGGVDAMTSVIFHELSETVTDPDLNAWYDSRGNENGDKCAWRFGTTFKTSNGAVANVSFGGRNWKLQQNWVNASGGYCALAY